MAKAFLAVCWAFACLGASAAKADTAVAAGTECQVSKPDDVAAPITPSVAAGNNAANNKNWALAEANFRPLAEKGDPQAERNLGRLLMTNCTGLKDTNEGVTWLGKAVDANDIPATAQLGIIYMNGNGVAQDDNKAFSLLSKAAAAGNSSAERALGYLYLSGRGVAQDKYEGLLWSIQAARQADATALSNIAWHYFQGDALPQSNEKAAFYIALAVQHASPADKPLLLQVQNEIAQKVSQEDMQDGARHARDWSPGEYRLSEVIKDAARRRGQNS
ncbi:MAG TPA: tetratricopeptide repeat protein [Rhizomicrobium sp.]|jgi:TPR repeat protein|nr:tetratricopeptide repeat protein [Rhizomicrobium sp.]